MFEGLRARLQKVQGALEKNIAGAASPQGSDIPQLESTTDTGKDPTLLTRVRVLITDREFLISEKDIEEPLFELEMILLENDVALPVADEILRRVKEELS